MWNNAWKGNQVRQVNMKEAHITAGECLKIVLSSLYPDITFIPFNEAMIEGDHQKPYFTFEFIKKRASVHKVSPFDYQKQMQDFLSLLENINSYQRLILWFGDDDFCIENVKFIKDLLKEYAYQGEVILHTVDEIKGTIKNTKLL